MAAAAAAATAAPDERDLEEMLKFIEGDDKPKKAGKEEAKNSKEANISKKTKHEIKKKTPKDIVRYKK